MKTENRKWMRGIGNASYIIGIAFLIASLLANALPTFPVFANGNGGGSDCSAENNDGDNDFCELIEGDPQSGDWTAPTDYKITGFVIKAGTDDFGAVDGCYVVNQSESSVSWNRIGDGPDCKEISHVEIYYTYVPPPCPWNPEILASNPHCMECPWKPGIWIGDAACFEPCWFDSSIPADSPNCPEQCMWNPQIPADDPACFQPCSFDPSIPVGDPLCKPCPYNERIGITNPACEAPCPYDPSIPASDPACQSCPFNPSIGINDPACPGPCQWDPTIPETSDLCLPCPFNSELGINDPACPKPCKWDKTIPETSDQCLACPFNPEIGINDPGCPGPCEWDETIPETDGDCKVCPFNPDIGATDPDCQEVCPWNSTISVEDNKCKPYVSMSECYNPIKGKFETSITNEGVTTYYIGYDIQGKKSLQDLGLFSPAQVKKEDVSYYGDPTTLRLYASLTGDTDTWVLASSNGMDPEKSKPCLYDPARVEVSCNPNVEEKLTWTVHNDNAYALDYFWSWNLITEPGGMGNVDAYSSDSFTTEYLPATMQIRLGTLQFNITPENCFNPPPDETPTQPPRRITPTDPYKPTKVAPPVATSEILIPVTGTDSGQEGDTRNILVNLGIAFLGLGLVFNGVARARKEWDI